MSRYLSRLDHHPLTRVVGTMLALLVSLSVAAPSAVGAQDGAISDQAVEQRWQLLTYRDPDGTTQPAPAGVGATLQLFAGSAFGEAACSTYESSYSREAQNIFIDPPSVEPFDCDPASEAFDEAFYQNLANATSVGLSESGSIMTLRNNIDEPLMTFTRAVIDDDPTVARWELARIGAADGAIEPVIAGLDPWIEFLRGGRLVGNTGCGSFLGSYQVNDGTMRIGDVAYRLEGCTESARQQAEAMVAAFDSITDFAVLPAGMALRDEAGTTRLALVPAIDLAARTWTPVAIFDDLGETLYDEERLSTSAVKFQGPSAEGRTICRPFEGDSLSSGLALSTANLSLAGTPCKKGDLQDVEDAFMRALQETSSQALRGSELELKDVNGLTLMRLLPQAELVGTTWVVTDLNRTPKRAKPARREPIPETTITATFEDIVETVSGDTGATAGSGANFYVAGYRTPAAARIIIEDVTVEGRACNGNKAGSPACQQQGLYLTLLQAADSYIVQEGELRLLQGQAPLIWFVPEAVQAPTP